MKINIAPFTVWSHQLPVINISIPRGINIPENVIHHRLCFCNDLIFKDYIDDKKAKYNGMYVNEDARNVKAIDEVIPAEKETNVKRVEILKSKEHVKDIMMNPW
jgi:hypothetical protein